MESREVKQHWEGWAKEHGTSVRATTMGETAKMLEIEALARCIGRLPAGLTVLEVGCGNGINCVELAKRFPQLHFYGVDYIPDMVRAAKANAKAAGVQDRVRFTEGNLLDLHSTIKIDQTYDVVFTCRCLINLSRWEVQKEAIGTLAGKVRSGGYLLMIENLVEGREQQNRLREVLGLEPRQLMPPFNRFFTSDEIDEAIIDARFQEYHTEDISSLHDLMLYVMVPALQGKSTPDWDYDHPLVKIATELCIKSPGSNFGTYGQNVLFVCRKP